MDDSYGFTKTDDQKLSLPPEEVILMATSYKGEEIYFGFEKIKLQKENAVTLKLQKVGKKDLAALIENAI